MQILWRTPIVGREVSMDGIDVNFPKGADLVVKKRISLYRDDLGAPPEETRQVIKKNVGEFAKINEG